MVDVVNKR